jgi:Uma2 family endonuclease
MSATAAPEFWTAGMVCALPPDGQRHETVHGELLVTPAPRVWHEIVADRLVDALKEYFAVEPAGMALKATADISWAPDVLVQPDVFVAPVSELRTLDWAAVQSLLLVVEILSPSSARADRFAKRRVYQEFGVPLYWAVDADARQVECWTPEALFPRVQSERISWHPLGAAAPCFIELAELFRAL